RVASGFLAGVLDPGTQQYSVKEKDKHLWTEVYFANSGWVLFDAVSAADEADAAESEAANIRKKGLVGMLFQRGILPPLALLVFCVMLCYVFKVEVIDRLWRQKSLDLPSSLPLTNVTIIEAYETACRQLGKLGLLRTMSETPTEFLRRIYSDLHMSS